MTDKATTPPLTGAELDKLNRYSIDCDGLPFIDSDGVWLAYEDVVAQARAQQEGAAPSDSNSVEFGGIKNAAPASAQPDRGAVRGVPDGFVLAPIEPYIGERYAAGEWSRRNWEAALADLAEAPSPASQPVAPAALADAIQYLQNVAADAVPMLSHYWPKTAELLKGAVAALAQPFSQPPAVVSADDRTLPNQAILHDGIWYVPMHLVAAVAPSDAKGKADTRALCMLAAEAAHRNATGGKAMPSDQVRAIVDEVLGAKDAALREARDGLTNCIAFIEDAHVIDAQWHWEPVATAKAAIATIDAAMAAAPSSAAVQQVAPMAKIICPQCGADRMREECGNPRDCGIFGQAQSSAKGGDAVGGQS